MTIRSVWEKTRSLLFVPLFERSAGIGCVLWLRAFPADARDYKRGSASAVAEVQPVPLAAALSAART